MFQIVMASNSFIVTPSIFWNYCKSSILIAITWVFNEFENLLNSNWAKSISWFSLHPDTFSFGSLCLHNDSASIEPLRSPFTSTHSILFHLIVHWIEVSTMCINYAVRYGCLFVWQCVHVHTSDLGTIPLIQWMKGYRAGGEYRVLCVTYKRERGKKVHYTYAYG